MYRTGYPNDPENLVGKFIYTNDGQTYLGKVISADQDGIKTEGGEEGTEFSREYYLGRFLLHTEKKRH